MRITPRLPPGEGPFAIEGSWRAASTGWIVTTARAVLLP